MFMFLQPFQERNVVGGVTSPVVDMLNFSTEVKSYSLGDSDSHFTPSSSVYLFGIREGSPGWCADLV